MKVEIKEDWYFIFTSSIIWILGLLTSFIDFFFIQNFSVSNPITNLTGLIIFIFGISIRLISRKELKKSFSYMLKVRKDQILITTGIYSYVRHPAYTGDYIAQLGVTMIFSSLYGFVIMLFLILPFIYRIKIEEKMLISKFGKEYLEYKEKTKIFIPYLL
jgi:protein-S-isoprenylcysteine O-methyltransferase Ste14